ncbi:MAG TPA: GTP-binding protein [Cyanobacteria bacterium UBA11149]|nr:GTP-binding protein [Cyanobacteria bacterium UBA11366]HBK63877.1 GTP-binding protein [Cyanobacteria bacterium UBA11166]HBR75715.1 GTP-binding protein [Cyanobacteria bacterium UBA11159]HBS70663.1 GTP-binding protein [Cyanobacteria bacterium UBA11153]HBW89133.1 GTP-binding protein [Cyanobacteria bacterium UBA11149]
MTNSFPEYNPQNPPDTDLELDNAAFSVAQIQAEVNYKQAQDALKDLVKNLDLTSQEKAGLESDIEELTNLLNKLNQTSVQIAAFGMVGRGKSSVLNALLGQPVFETGPLHGVTQNSQTASWQLSQETIGDSDREILRVALPSIGNSQIQLIDTPGIDEVDGETREALALTVAKQADLILFVIAGDMTKVEYEALCQLREFGKPMLLIFNKIDQYPEADRLEIYHKIRDERVKQLLSPSEIVMVAASPLVAIAVRRPDGSRAIKRESSKPQIDELKLKILEILHREGKSLVALNTMLYAGEVNEQIVQRKMSIREESADKIIWRAVKTKAIAIALNPVTVVDIFTATVVDVVMILALSHLYGIPMSQPGAIALLQKIAISMGGISASEILATLGLSGIKGLLGLSAPATGGISLAPYLSVAITQAGVAGVSSYAIGQVTKTYLANGASWGEDSPKAVVTRILSSLDETSILNRIKEELAAKLGNRG